jgi:sugar lactone lactonase YvrE
VYDAIQDKEGFMWFATDNGLSRFDGKNFKTFTTKDGLPDNEVLKLFLDSRGRLWIMPFRPSVCYYYKGKIHNKDNDSLLAKINLSAYAHGMAEDKNGNLFIIEAKAWHEILADKTVRTVNNLNKLTINVHAIGTDKNGGVQILFEVFDSLRQSLLIHTSLKDIVIFKNKPKWADPSGSLLNSDYIIIRRKHTSEFWIYRDSSNFASIPTPLSTVSMSYIDKQKIIINTRAGIKFFNPETHVFSDSIFTDFSFTSAFQDKENNLWLTTNGSGVLMIPSFQFINFTLSDDKKRPEITALCLQPNYLFAGGWGKKYWKLKISDLTFSSHNTNIDYDEKMISILPYNKKLLLFGGAYYQNPVTGEIRPYTLKSVSLGKKGILFAAHANVWLCTWSGKEEMIWYERATSAVEKDSGFYIGTLGGLYYQTYSGERTDLGKKFPVLASRIVNIAVSDKNILWITTKGNGIVAYADNQLLYHLTEANGLTSDNCTSLWLDSNTVWLGTDKGLNRIEMTEKGSKITRFSMSDGLPSNMINTIAAKGNKVFAGTPLGLTYFEVDKISQQSACDLQLTGIYLANKYWTYDSSNFSLSHKNNDIRFEFSGISFRSAGEMKYQYRMLGLQPEWRTTTDEQLSFPALSSGKYSLQLRAINKYGVESKIKEVSFTIEKSLREKTWFRLLILFLLIDTIWLFFRYRIGNVRRKAKEQAILNQRIADLEQKALRSQMNPHFIFNSLNSIQQYVAERDITGANNFITDFSRLIRMTLDLSTNTFITIADEIDYITTYLKVEKTRLENQFDYSINIDKTLNLHEIYVPSLLLQPYVENSIRHGIKYKKDNKGVISISVQRKEADILVSVEDNGIGREAAQQYKTKYHIQYQSKGMSINNDRIDILNTYNDKKIKIFIHDLYDEHRQARGTRVELYLTP